MRVSGWWGCECKMCPLGIRVPTQLYNTPPTTQEEAAPNTHPTPSYLIRRVCVTGSAAVGKALHTRCCTTHTHNPAPTDDTDRQVATPPRPNYIDIDAEGPPDTLACGTYASSIYDAMRTSEVQHNDHHPFCCLLFPGTCHTPPVITLTD